MYGHLEGYASVFHIPDAHNDVVLSTAFANLDLASFEGQKMNLLWEHNQLFPIGFVEGIDLDASGLYVKCKIALDSFYGSEVYNLIRNGLVDGLSIGYRTLSCLYNSSIGIRYLTDVELCEISVVSVPSNGHSKIERCYAYSTAAPHLSKIIQPTLT